MLMKTILLSTLIIMNFAAIFPEEPYTCLWVNDEQEACNQKFLHETTEQFFRHLFNHFNLYSPKVCLWENCYPRSTYLSKKHITRHINKNNPNTHYRKENPESLQCQWQYNDADEATRCHKAFDNESSFYKHCTFHVSISRAKTISICKWFLKEQQNCCNILFAEPQKLIDHVRTHTREYTFFCSCGKQFITHRASVFHRKKCTKSSELMESTETDEEFFAKKTPPKKKENEEQRLQEEPIDLYCELYYPTEGDNFSFNRDEF